jgi:DNA primase
MEIIDQIRQVANIVEVASLYTTLRKRGKKHVGLCPFHSEKGPSFTVDSEKQLFHCFGCGVGGDVFTLIMEKENLSFPEALKYLAEKYHIPLPRQTKLSPELVKLEEKIFKINETALAFFRRNLFQTKEGEGPLGYLRKRNLSAETLETLKVGYAPNSWNALLTYFQGKGVDLPLLEKAGLVLPGQKKPDYYDRFRGRVIFPIFSLTGKVVGFGGRTVIDADPKYLNSPDTPVYSKGKILYGLNWTKESVREAGEVILVEGYTDFASLYQAGIKNIAASLGTSLTIDQAELARRFATNIILNYDGDSAGKMATSRGISIFIEQGQSPKIVILPEDLDPDSYLQKYGTERYLMQLKKGSVPLIKFLVDYFSTTGRLNTVLSTVYERIQIAEKIINLVGVNPKTLEGSEHLRQLSGYLNLEEQLLRDRIKGKSIENNTEERDFFLPAEKRLLQILLENHTITPQLFPKTREEDFRGLKSEPAFKIMVESHKKGKKVVFPELSRAVEPDLARCLSQMMQEQAGQGTVEEALDCLRSLRKASLESQLKALQKEIVRCERNGETDILKRLLSQKQNLTKEILAT